MFYFKSVVVMHSITVDNTGKKAKIKDKMLNLSKNNGENASVSQSCRFAMSARRAKISLLWLGHVGWHQVRTIIVPLMTPPCYIENPEIVFIIGSMVQSR